MADEPKHEGLVSDKNGNFYCIKCKVYSGDGWGQCDGICPVPGSPHYFPDCAERLKKIAEKEEEINQLWREIQDLRSEAYKEARKREFKALTE